MKKMYFKLIISGVMAFLVSVGMVFITNSPVFAAEPTAFDACVIDDTNPACKTDGNLFKTYSSILNVVLAVAGVIATVIVIIGGVMMTTSQGDPGKVKKARSAIIYALIGLVVTLLSFAIVNFVLNSVFSPESYTSEDSCKGAGYIWDGSKCKDS